MLKTVWDCSNKSLNINTSLVTKFRGNRMPVPRNWDNCSHPHKSYFFKHAYDQS